MAELSLLVLNEHSNVPLIPEQVGNKKLKKLNPDDITVIATNTSAAPRRSTRRRKYRDVKVVTVSSNLTLLQLKILVRIDTEYQNAHSN